MLKLLKPEIRGSIGENTEEEVEEETRSFYTPTKSVRISSTQNDPNISRNNNTEQKLIHLGDTETTKVAEHPEDFFFARLT